MEEPFEIPVNYRGESLSFTTRLIRFGYIHRFQVDLNGYEVFFEQDDEGKYRAQVDTAKLNDSVKIDVGLLKAVAEAIEDILK